MTFSALGRKLRQGTEVVLSDRLYGEILGMRKIEMAEGLRLEAFLQVATTGRYVVHKRGHAFAVVDGVVHDWEGTTRPETMLTRVWQVTPRAREKMARMAQVAGLD